MYTSVGLDGDRVNNDILVYSQTNEKHEMHLREVLETVRREGIYAKFSRC